MTGDVFGYSETARRYVRRACDAGIASAQPTLEPLTDPDDPRIRPGAVVEVVRTYTLIDGLAGYTRDEYSVAGFRSWMRDATHAEFRLVAEAANPDVAHESFLAGARWAQAQQGPLVTLACPDCGETVTVPVQLRFTNDDGNLVLDADPDISEVWTHWETKHMTTKED